MIQIDSSLAWSIAACAFMSAQCIYDGNNCYIARQKYGVEYPDMGSGRYAAKLSDQDWADFNRTLRIHQNYVEQIPIAISSTLLSGLFYPRLSATLAGTFIFARFAYSFGYNRGVTQRLFGALLKDLCLLGMIGATAVGAIGVIRGL